MDNKLFVTIIVVAAVIAGVSIAAFNYDSEDGTSDDSGMFNVIARANSEGSGIYISETIYSGIGTPERNDTYFFGDGTPGNYSVSSANKAAWGGLVFGTPGTSSIQHTQIADLANQMGLKFKLYTYGEDKSNDTIYYDSGVTKYTDALSNDVIDGGILWEPQYQLIITDGSNKYKELALTNDVFPGHTCCVIAGNSDYMKKNELATEKFLAGYVRGVEDIKNILSDKTSPEYAEFIAFVKTKVIALNESSDDVVAKALDNITYLYADDATGNLDDLEKDIANLVKDLKTLNAFKKDVSNPELFAEEFVKQTYLKKAISEDLGTSSTGRVKVAVITGDIHQIAIHWADEKGYFSSLGLGVDIVGSNNGAGVATALINGEATLGFLGAPPATITTVNAGYITA